MKCNLPRDQEFAREKQNESLPILKTLCLYQLLYFAEATLFSDENTFIHYRS